MREQIEKSARHLYGMIHARYIVTTRGLAKMVNLSLSQLHVLPLDDRLISVLSSTNTKSQNSENVPA